MSCFVPGCPTGYKSDTKKNKELGIKNPSLFKARTRDILEKWRIAISRPDKLLTERDRVCARHFRQVDIETEYKTVMPDGTINRIPKGKPTLKSTAIPLILLDSSENSTPSHSLQTNKRTIPAGVEGCSVPKKLKKYDDSSLSNCGPACEEEIITNGHELNPNIATDFDSQETVNTSGQPVSEDGSECAAQSLLQCIESISVPSPFWASNVVNGNVMFTCWAENLATVAKRVVIQQDLSLRIFLAEREIHIAGLERVKSVNEIAGTLNKITDILPCKGADDNKHANNCSGYIQKKKLNQTGRQGTRCLPCKKFRKSLKQKTKRMEPLQKEQRKNYKLKRSHENVKRRNKTLKQKILQLRQQVKNMQTECSKAKAEAVQEAILNLPQNQQLAVQACLTASQIKDSKGMRYTNEWIFECLLLRIKSRKVYEHLRAHKILTLPCMDTLRKYIEAIKGAYGFNAATFKVLKEKVKHMNPREKHGVILLDEMKLSKSISFDRQNLKLQGFTDLGQYTPEHQKNKRGDHALVLMFQPFHGKWVQALACFLSKGCAPGAILHNILMECIALTEQCGLHVDVIASDGATWNRAMWDKFGVTEETVSVEHIVDPARRLWFVSDFPHLIKNLRNWISKKRIHDGVWTLDGTVKLNHWDALLEIENPRSFNLKANFKLTKEHIRPEYYQKMNVAMAFQFFGVAHAMELFENDHEALKDSKGTQLFCLRIKKLINAMNSRTPMGSMKIENQAWNDVKETLEYLRTWENEAKAKQYDFVSDSTCYGLKISLQAALEVCRYLIEQCEFKYLMTARLNQDNLERFFGMMRSCCGNNDHPDSTLFIQMYRLLSTYSLVKPPKGSNITGGDTIDVLLSIKDLTDINERRSQWDSQIDTILDRGTNMDALFDAASVLKEHDYFKCSTSDYVLAYISGYVARKGTRFAVFDTEGRAGVCSNCLQSLELKASDVVPDSHKLIQIKTEGFLKHPSMQLQKLISLLEEATLETLNAEELNANTLFSVTSAVEKIPSIPLVGCEKHQLLLTNSIVRFYLTTRMFFVCKQANKNDNIEKKRTRERRKASKLAYAADGPKENDPTENTIPRPTMNRALSKSKKIALTKKQLTSKENTLLPATDLQLVKSKQPRVIRKPLLNKTLSTS